MKDRKNVYYVYACKVDGELKYIGKGRVLGISTVIQGPAQWQSLIETSMQVKKSR